MIEKLIFEACKTILGTSITYLLPLYLTTGTLNILQNKITINKVSKYNGFFIKTNTNSLVRRTPINEYYEVLKEYIDKLGEFTSSKNMNTVCRNIVDLKLTKIPYMSLMGAAGSYDCKENIIRYSKEEYIGHEFLHMASGVYDSKNKFYYCGFKIKKGTLIYGLGLNEGYTELLASRIFNKDNKIHSYHKEVLITKIIELFFKDKKEMEYYYFNHDMEGFIKYMSQYIEYNDLMNIIGYMDSLSNSSILGNPIPNVVSKSIIIKLYNYLLKSFPEHEKEFFDIIKKDKVLLMLLNNNTKRR